VAPGMAGRRGLRGDLAAELNEPSRITLPADVSD